MSLRPLLIFLCALAIGALATLAATAGAGAADDEQRYTVVLDNAFGLTEGSDLRSAGVTIGTIDKLGVQRSTARALATIVITLPSFAGFREDVRCEVKPQSLIGEYYLDCDPGKTDSPAPRTIPVEQTGGTIPPDLVLDILRRPARERFGLILTELGIGFTARGEDVQTTLRRAVPALRETERVLSILDANSKTLRQLTRDADTVLAGLADNRRNVGRFIREAADTTEISASRSEELAQTVNKLPRFLRELRPTLADLGTTARLQTPALRDLRRAAPDLTELLQRLGPFAESARPAVRGLGEASETGITAVKDARSTVKQLRALGAASTEPMRNLRFVLEDIDNRDRAVEPNRLSPTGTGFTGLEALLQYFFVQSQAINVYDSKGFILKLNILLNECSQYTNAQTAREEPERTKRCNSWLGPNQPGITTEVSRTTRNKPKDEPTPDKREDTPAPTPATTAPTAEAPAAPAAPPPPPPTLLPGAKELLDKILPDLPDVPSLLPRSSRSSAESERNLLDYLLGP
ncbi:MAG TPA: MlaD family protein [Solirubrobacteraceae bacterium]|nr:MlaD family protein [Solirubrobacteraceae bacterium]